MKDLFILGAGASKPYGYPLGVELRDQIIKSIQGNGDLKKALQSTFQGIDGKIKQFPDDLEQSLRFSIDQFLATRGRDYLDIGKFALAYIIKRRENEKRSHYLVEGNWVEYFFNIYLGLDEGEILEKNYGFITYNYDRSLEFLLSNAFKVNFEKSPEQISNQLKQRIHHVYGSLGDYKYKSSDPGVPFSTSELSVQTKEFLDLIYDSSTNLNLIFDERDTNQIPKNFFDDLERVFFLGFGFDETNFKRLGINWENFSGEVYCTGFGFTISEEERAKDLFHTSNHVYFHRDYDCLMLLREYL